MYSGYKSFIRHMICKLFGLPSHSLSKNRSFKLFSALCFGVVSKNSLLSLWSQRFFSNVFFKRFVILGFTFRSVILLELFSEYGSR